MFYDQLWWLSDKWNLLNIKNKGWTNRIWFLRFRISCTHADLNVLFVIAVCLKYISYHCIFLESGGIKNVSFIFEISRSCKAIPQISTEKKITWIPVVVKYYNVNNGFFQCQVSGDGPFQVRWVRLDGNRLPVRASTSPSNTLTIRDLRSEDTGRYVCRATNRFGTTSEEVVLRVIEGEFGCTFELVSDWRWLIVNVYLFTLTCAVEGRRDKVRQDWTL